MKTNTRNLAFSAAASGLSSLIHAYQTWSHYQFRYGHAEGKSFCNINPTFDCDAVNVSAFSNLFNMPLALWGFWTSLVLALVCLGALLNEDNRSLRQGAFWGSAFVAGVSLVMLIISHSEVGKYCLMCMGNYVLSAVAFGTLWGLRGEAKEYFSNLLSRVQASLFRWELFALLSVPMMTFMVHDMVSKSLAGGIEVAVLESKAEWQVNPVHELDPNDGIPLKGPGDYPMVIVEFADLLCPHCKLASRSLHNFASSRSDVQLIFKHFPLDSTCNSAIGRPGASCPLAKAVVCGHKQNRGWEVHDWLFANQGTVVPSQLSSPPAELGLETAAFVACLESPEAHDTLLRQSKTGFNAGIKGTPTVFVNGRMLPRGQLIPVLDAVYREIKR